MLIISRHPDTKISRSDLSKKFCVLLLTELLVAVEQVTEPDLHLSDFRVYNEMFDRPSVVRHMSFNRPRAFNVF